jgi:putative toxin-antitoxin system antitoxin component (TIGR02293 family)
MSKATGFLKHVGEGAAAYEIHKDIVGGLPFRIIATVAEQAGLAAEELARRIGVSRSTFHRRKKTAGSRLSTQESDALARYASLAAKAVETFDGDEDAARRWLGTPQPGLGDIVPLEIARTTPGYREVEKLLTRIDHGVYA